MLGRLATSLSLLLTLTLTTVAIPLPPFMARAAANQLVKASTPAVYYVGDNGQRYVFSNQPIYHSWFADFSSVLTISDAELASYPIGGAIFYRPGTRLVKITTDPKVYGVGPGGALHPIASEAAAITLYGATWAQRIDDLPDAFFASYTVSTALSGTAHPAGTLIRYTDNNNYYVLAYHNNVLHARRISNVLITSFGLDKANAIAVPSSAFPYPLAGDWTSAEASFFLPHQPTATAPTPAPGDNGTPGDPGSPDPTPSSTTLAVTAYTGLKPLTYIVRNDDYARIYAFTLTGDPFEAATISQVRLQIYIDAGGETDFDLGADADGQLFWPANQILADFRLRDLETGTSLSPAVSLTGGNGDLAFSVAIDVGAGEKRHIELTADVRTVVPNARLSADLTTATAFTATTTDGQTPNISGPTTLNGAKTPSIVVKPLEYGSLTIDSTNPLGDAVYTLGSTMTPYNLTLTANGEPFRVSAFDLGFTSLGSDIYVINHVQTSYTTETGVSETENESSIDEALERFQFRNLEIFIPKNETVTLPLTVISFANSIHSGARLQVKFLQSNFNASGLYSGLQYTEGQFGDLLKLDDNTSSGPLALFRLGSVSFGAHADSPKTTVTRYNTIPVLTFNLTAKDHAISITKLTVRVETSDVDKNGDDNDFFERVADTFANSVIRLAAHGPDIDDRNFYSPTTVDFAIYDKSTNTLDTTPAGLQTDAGDYGVFVLNFSGSALTVQPGQTLAIDVDINTTLISSVQSESIRARLLGDTQSTAVSQANLHWNDGSNIITTGYLVGGLDLLGSNLSVL